MAIQKEKTLASGVVADYWRLKSAFINVDTMTVAMELGLYLDSDYGTDGSDAVFVKPFVLTISPEQLATGSLANAYTRILAKANEDVPNLGSEGTHKFDADLAGGSIV